MQTLKNLKTAPTWAHLLAVPAAALMLVACQPAQEAAPAPAPAPAETAPAAPAPEAQAPQAQPAAAAHDFADLAQHVGTYPHDAGKYLEQGNLAQRLKTLLGELYPVLLENTQVAGPLSEDAGRLFVTGNRPHEGGSESAAIVIDPAQNALRVWLQHDGKTQEWTDPNTASIEWPQDVQTMIQNAADMPK